MVPRRAVTALLFVQFIALALSAQQSAEFGRAAGGEMLLTPKGSASLSGSLELSLRGSSPGYGMTAGGTLLQDRLWFFASGARQEWSLPENATTRAVGARVNGQVADNHDFAAFFNTARRPELSTLSTPVSVPSSFLALRYIGIVSSNMLFSASFTRGSRTVPSQ